ncbi:hypothetical protein SAMN05216559_0191 [Halomicrobium zhouii]|uniref:TM2 domain-containing protein n=1 Tax=Halomicrobium zhouii TaxID=767519 RepID=A0A1I6K4M3_9EURY|nr:hypothetical protein [Halomicrobium zhouii]SFR86213.1 hypothetical protein SAMN05216559_0191 [Halomicrobium zhouii]
MAEAQADATGGSGNEQLIALVLSFVIPGVGQLYQGRKKEGIAFFGGFVLAIVLSMVLTVVTLGLGAILVPIIVGSVWALGLYDTYAEWLEL